MNDDEITDEVVRLLPSHISDESASVICDFLAELSMAADSRYLCQIRHHREKNRPPVDPGYPWRNTQRD